MSSDQSTDRTSVKTYVPTYQKSEWRRHAEDLDMSQSEFVRTMVQAGRTGFSIGGSEKREETPDQGSNPGGDGLETHVQNALKREGVLAWDDLLEELSGDLEDRLEDALDKLQSADRVRYSGRDGGYVLIGDER